MAATALPVLFVLDHDLRSLAALLSDLSGRFGNDFAAIGTTSPTEAQDTLRHMAAAREPVALILAGDKADGFLARAHSLHPHALRVLLVDRNYSAASRPSRPALGYADCLVRPWTNDETMYRAISECLAGWEQEHATGSVLIVHLLNRARVGPGGRRGRRMRPQLA